MSIKYRCRVGDRTRQSRENRGLFGRDPHESIYRLRSKARRERDACQHCLLGGSRAHSKVLAPTSRSVLTDTAEAYRILLAHPPNLATQQQDIYFGSACRWIRLPAEENLETQPKGGRWMSLTYSRWHASCRIHKRLADVKTPLSPIVSSLAGNAVLPTLGDATAPSETILAKPIPTTNYNKAL